MSEMQARAPGQMPKGSRPRRKRSQPLHAAKVVHPCSGGAEHKVAKQQSRRCNGTRGLGPNPLRLAGGGR